jgi:hypothetical protein
MNLGFSTPDEGVYEEILNVSLRKTKKFDISAWQDNEDGTYLLRIPYVDYLPEFEAAKNLYIARNYGGGYQYFDLKISSISEVGPTGATGATWLTVKEPNSKILSIVNSSTITSYKLSLTWDEHLLELSLYAEAEAEDERLRLTLENFGRKIDEEKEFIFKDSDIKEELTDFTLLQEKQMPITAFLMTVKMNQFFQEPEAKEFIFKTQIDFVNSGFPFPIFDYFNFANIEPSLELSWSPQFYLYKGLFFSGKKNEYWSKYYFNKIKETKNPTLSFYEVIELYKNGNLKEAKKKLEAWLKEYSKEGDEVLTKKVIRTLARIEFEQENYAKSFQLYDDFLLKTKIIDPQDYLETAWPVIV